MTVRAAEKDQVYGGLLEWRSATHVLTEALDEQNLVKGKLAFRPQTLKGDVQSVTCPY